MSDNEQKPAKVLRTSSGKTRLTARDDADAPAVPADAPAVPADAPGDSAGPGGGKPASGKPASGSQRGAETDWSAPTVGTPQASGGQTRVSSASKGMRLTAGGGDTKAQPAAASGPDHSPLGGVGSSGAGAGSGVKASSSGVKMSGKSKKKGPRTVRLTIASIDPWSVMKMSFLLSLAIAIAMLVATLVLWLVLQATGVMGNIESTLSEIAGAESADQLLALVSLGRVMATAFVLALVNIVLMTALSTLFAFLYNIGASIVGGFHLTLTDD